MKKNITLIGMPGSGKSTIGVILSKQLSFDFIDTDILIQKMYQTTLQNIVDEKGYMKLREIEKNTILSINSSKNVIATGGSAVYENESMLHLKNISYVIFLKVDFDTLTKRVKDFDKRGIAKAKHQTFSDLYDERNILYGKYSDFTIENSSATHEETVHKIVEYIKTKNLI